MTKSKGDKTDPCGRPSLKVLDRPTLALTLTRACRFVSHELIHTDDIVDVVAVVENDVDDVLSIFVVILFVDFFCFYFARCVFVVWDVNVFL